ncbi:toll/interleukin-1 receptor domain-containing protein [Solimonas sp. K1W22B-7]|uniref:toll/interleukin-1 receptor domain-containing protein n=1 Tax=Solimonas sp. K1W22B-7 TaxID=2303331 RepID=UPI000E3349CB|nr:toll/interleukin-1 receptor domain-containing protein [Solimonas sp. K1W22B-7]AXQ27780.1 toll/interleukin-1 receptor domain-containing protein [Solimonas sp. K1W22B-7]
MNNDKSYIISLDYGDRKKEREFVRQLLQRYDKDSLTGCALFVNNNPYSLESFLCLNFEKGHDDFECWLGKSFPSKKRDYRFLFSEIADAVFSKGFNVVTFSDDSMLEIQMSERVNGIYLYPDRSLVDDIFGKPVTEGTFTVFLSHSSKDKVIVDSIFSALHKAGIRAWYDRYEIQPGDSITDRINEGLKTSGLGLIFLSKNFLHQQSGWTMSEANFFLQERMRDKKKKFIVVNIDLSIDQMPPLLRDYRFIDLSTSGAHQEIVDAIVRAKRA